ncbi:unnamed protein product [Urochloa decumbens]|uniref:Uncharacterized protein n=1 Tax=Urochloa decumbens TaxID=240449 RepID=A0ABC8VEB6_9POAL
MATVQVVVQSAIAGKPADSHYAAAAAPFLGDEEAASIPNDGHHQADINADAGCRLSWLPAFLGFVFLTLNSATAIVRCRGDAAAFAFVGLSYADLVALFLCLRMYGRAPAGSSARSWLKVAVWILTTLLTLAFSGKVAAVMPPPVAVVVWLVAFATIAGGFVAFFVCKEKKVAPEEQSWKETTCTGACLTSC